MTIWKKCQLLSLAKNWSTIEREAFSVLEALRKFDTWIFGSQIQVISDHDPLTYLTNSAPHSAKLTRWALALQRYNVKVSYRRGSAHGNADALSRLRISE
ncbi:retrovirus-related Pol polyprotein from transposon 297 [Trichonephila clavata]|uniref:Retrovirus-related Pol polyprotein from transposon 297 n=1 Tax=Trichonephila clavata TaxID=2740835 RepID=A0A8X6GZC8_TRICU|nr:retrovirus-related Pol polyprotein from transposon 297 [Trichonephila clavata]